jgi:hypothetical protein
MEELMRRYTLAIGIAALSAIPTAAFSESIHVKPGGVSIGSSHQRHYNRYQGLYDLHESKRCRASRAACMHKQNGGMPQIS